MNRKTWFTCAAWAGGLVVIAMEGALGCLSSDNNGVPPGLDASPGGDGSPGTDASPSLDASSQDAALPIGVVQLAATGPTYSPPPIAIDSTSVYFQEWTTPTTSILARVSVNGGDVTTLAASKVNALAIDGTSVYWFIDGTISKVPLAGGITTVLLTPDAGVSQNPTLSLAVDGTHLYWPQSGGQDPSTGAVQTAPLQGGAVTNLATAQIDPLGLVVNATNVFWSSADGSGSVMTASLDGGALKAFATSSPGQVSSWNLALDANNVYWTTAGSAKGNGNDCVVMKAPLAGGASVQLASGEHAPGPLASDGTNLYWTVSSEGTIMKVAVGGGTPIALVTGRSSPSGIAVDATSVYWQESGGIMKLTPK